MKLLYPASDIKTLVARQLDHFLPLPPAPDRALLNRAVDRALERMERCLAPNGNKYVRRDGETVFDPLHSGQYLIFLYYLSNSLFAEFQAPEPAARVYNVNRALHGADLYYEVQLPDVFYVSHPLGSVMGRASYGDFFQFRQNCTVGGNKGIYPVVGKNVLLWTGSSIIGNCNVGNNCVLSVGTMVKDQDVPSNCLVFGRSPDLIFKSRPPAFFSRKDSFQAVDLDNQTP